MPYPKPVSLSLCYSSTHRLPDDQLMESIRVLDEMGKEFQALSVWSINELYQKMDEVAYKGEPEFIYLGRDYWDTHTPGLPIEMGKKDITVPLPKNPTWKDIWKAADQAIKQSTDHHHIFIERIDIMSYNAKIYLTMRCGS